MGIFTPHLGHTNIGTFLNQLKKINENVNIFSYVHSLVSSHIADISQSVYKDHITFTSHLRQYSEPSLQLQDVTPASYVQHTTD